MRYLPAAIAAAMYLGGVIGLVVVLPLIVGLVVVIVASGFVLWLLRDWTLHGSEPKIVVQSGGIPAPRPLTQPENV